MIEMSFQFFHGGFMEEKKFNPEVVHSVYNSIKELYLDYCEELEQEKRNLEKLQSEIKEVEDYLSYLNSHQNSDAFVFSPRGVISKNSSSSQESVYDTGKVIDFSDTQKKKDELVSLESSKRTSEEKINKLNSKIAILSDNKNILKEVAKVGDSFEEEKKCLEEKKNKMIKEYEYKTAGLSKNIKDGPLDKLSYISHMIDLIDSYIDTDPMRAKLELKTIKEKVSSVSDSLEQLI